jgi:hypothetical protein
LLIINSIQIQNVKIKYHSIHGTVCCTFMQYKISNEVLLSPQNILFPSHTFHSSTKSERKYLIQQIVPCVFSQIPFKRVKEILSHLSTLCIIPLRLTLGFLSIMRSLKVDFMRAEVTASSPHDCWSHCKQSSWLLKSLQALLMSAEVTASSPHECWSHCKQSSWVLKSLQAVLMPVGEGTAVTYQLMDSSAMSFLECWIYRIAAPLTFRPSWTWENISFKSPHTSPHLLMNFTNYKRSKKVKYFSLNHNTCNFE